MANAFLIVLILLGVFFIFRALRPDSSKSRSSALDGFATRPSRKQFAPTEAILNGLGGFNDPLVSSLPKIGDFYRKFLLESGSGFTPGGIFFLKEILVVAAFVVVFLILRVGQPLATLFVLFPFFLPELMIWQARKKREFLIMRTFPEIVDLLSLCLSAGLDFTAALKWITEGRFMFNNPMVDELRKVKDEITLGKSRAQALKNMEQRLGIIEVSSLVRTLVIAENMGVSVSDALDRFSVDARDRRFHRGERQARVSAIKILFPLIFLILPVVGIVIMGPIVLRFSEQGFGLKM